ncbi:MAG: divergent PAP2 family protein [Clostridia bacterium]|nr:divergent PAP2 family protein [Clostridia bacterium]
MVVWNTIKDFFGNYILISAVLGWFIAQFLKIFTGFAETKKFHVKHMFANGGMPSSHSATVMALCIACAIQEGVASPYFAITAVLAIIVMNDASGVRYETGEQAKIINRITRELFSGKSEEVNTGLKELVGHTPFQVLMGALLGVCVAVIYGLILGVL